METPADIKPLQSALQRGCASGRCTFHKKTDPFKKFEEDLEILERRPFMAVLVPVRRSGRLRQSPEVAENRRKSLSSSHGGGAPEVTFLGVGCVRDRHGAALVNRVSGRDRLNPRCVSCRPAWGSEAERLALSDLASHGCGGQVRVVRLSEDRINQPTSLEMRQPSSEIRSRKTWKSVKNRPFMPPLLPMRRVSRPPAEAQAGSHGITRSGTRDSVERLSRKSTVGSPGDTPIRTQGSKLAPGPGLAVTV